VVSDLEALGNPTPMKFPIKVLTNDNNEREITATTITGDNIRYDSSPTPNMGIIVSPKKKFLIRSQSHTEVTSPIPNNNLSQSQKFNIDNSILNTQNEFDDENSTDDSVNQHFSRAQDLPTITHSNETNMNNNQQFKSIINNGNEQAVNNIQLRMDQNGVNHSTIKQPIAISNKRTFQQTNIGNILSR
jgi:hypothetical protein